MSVLTFLDIIGIQRFVFASNRLRDVVGGSLLVQDAAKKWLVELGAGDHIIVAAGGNAALRFGDKDQAKTFASRFSRRLMDRAPGLDVVIVHQPYDEGELATALLALQVKIAAAKTARRPSAALCGLGVTERCRETGLVAGAIDEGMPVATGVAARRGYLRKHGDLSGT